MAESNDKPESEVGAESEGNNDSKPGGDSSHGGGTSGNRSSYRQKYKHAWELDIELRDWLTACHSDAYAAYCKFCRTKLHAHKKGLLAHAKSTKHKKHVANPDFQPSALALMQNDPFNTDPQLINDFGLNGSDYEDDGRGSKRNSKGQRIFNDNWLKDPILADWLRKVPTNNTKALCIACRCIISAGRCELIKHTRAAKHKKAMEGGPFEEVSEADLQWLEFNDQSFSNNNQMSVHSSFNSQANLRPSVMDLPGLLVDDVLDRLDKHVPLEIAEKWDNVGIITKTTQPVKIYNVLLTIDLNERIVNEAIKNRAQFIISYHPPIFSPIKKLDPTSWKDKALLLCIENKITVYCPHTALDAIKGGINDWLISTFMTSEESKTRPIQHSTSHQNTSCLEVLLSEQQETVAQAFKDMNHVTMTDYGNSSTDVRVTCDDKTLPNVVEQLAQNNFAQVCSRVTQLAAIPIPGVGMGRIVTLGSPLPLYEVVQRTKAHLDLNQIRLALSPKHNRDTKITSIAACAGSGASVLKGCKADVWITGEMSHHDVLDAVNKGVTIILCEHTNTERGFLKSWSEQLKSSVFEDQVMVSVSVLDKDPLKIV